MSVFTIYLPVLLAIFGSTNDDNAPNINFYLHRLIINGRDAMDGEFPYQVSIQWMSPVTKKTVHICGGSIIDEYHVLTAAHCFDEIYKPIDFIVAGTRNLSNHLDPKRLTVTIEEAYVHEDYKLASLQNDISIIRVFPGFPQDNRFIRPIVMRTKELKVPAMCTVTGWGTTQYSKKKYPDILQALDVPLIEDEICQELYEPYQSTIIFSPGMLCAGFISGECDPCTKDSGGPLVCGGQLTGIVSWGKYCALPNNPGVYVNVAYYRDWIEKTLARSYEESGLKKTSF